MKSVLLTALLASSSLWGQANEFTSYQPAPENIKARQNFADSRFGIFLHWGLYSMFAQGEWYMQNENINNKEYAKSADAFYPHSFDAAAWISTFKKAGAKYICFTTRHHEGFSMWDTKQSTYNIMNTPYGKDIVRQLADECHRQGLGLHLYYSHIDWTRDDYPTGRTGVCTGKDKSKENWSQYYSFMNAQLTELLTEYGPVDCIWFDGMWDHDQDSIPFNWQLKEQYELIHRLQPACLIGNNHHSTPYEGEDIQMFERDVPGENKSGLSGQNISELPLETCETMNGMWGYKIKDQNYKSTKELLRLLVRSAAKGANLLLNVGPQANGELPAMAVERLNEMGKWLNSSMGESIYKTQAGPVAIGDSIVSTYNKDTRSLYLHLLTEQNVEELTLPCSHPVSYVQDLYSNKKIDFKYNKKDKTLFLKLPAFTNQNVDYVLKVQEVTK